METKKIAVRYYSRSGKTRKLAEAVAGALGVTALPVDQGLREPADLLFLGTAVYAGDIHKETEKFIRGLTPETVKQAVLFGTSAGPDNLPAAKVRELLAARGIPMAESTFRAPGGFLFMNRGRPGEADLAAAAEFARGFLSE